MYPSPTSVGGANAAGMVTADYSGSWDEWYERVVGDLINRYIKGLGGMGGYGDASIGIPAQADFGAYASFQPGADPSAYPPISYQTVAYWENYVRKFGAQDPWIIQHYGVPPERRATYTPDPNSPAQVSGSWQDRAAHEAEQAALDRIHESERTAAQIASNERIAQMQADVAREGYANQLKIATMEDATRRYIAEGDWGLQKYVAELREAGETERLHLMLGDREKDRAQQALFEKQRHHEAMVGLALEVAKYDAQLAAEPRNWLKYAAWLRSRDVVVNGLTLAMAADVVPDEAIDPATVGEATGSGLAALQVMEEGLATGASGGSATGTGENPFSLPQAPAQMGQYQAPPSAEQLSQHGTDYAALAKQLLGMNPLEASADQATPENLQAISNSLKTSAVGGKVPSFGDYTGPNTNALGMQVSESTGQKVNYSNFLKLLPSQQQMKLGEIASLGRYEPDFIKEMQASRPKGGASGAAAFG